MTEIESLKAYFDERFTLLERSLMQEINHLSEKLSDALRPVTKDVDRLRADIAELYGKTADNSSHIAQLEQIGKERQRYSTTLIAVLSIIIAAAGIIIGQLV